MFLCSNTPNSNEWVVIKLCRCLITTIHLNQVSWSSGLLKHTRLDVPGTGIEDHCYLFISFGIKCIRLTSTENLAYRRHLEVEEWDSVAGVCNNMYRLTHWFLIISLYLKRRKQKSNYKTVKPNPVKCIDFVVQNQYRLWFVSLWLFFLQAYSKEWAIYSLSNWAVFIKGTRCITCMSLI